MASKKRNNERIRVGRKNYKIIGKLGEGTATVYLATNEADKKVTIKDYNFNPDVEGGKGMAYYEVGVSQFLREQGEMVPRVIAFDRKKGLVVKDYYEGITGPELKKHWKSLGLTEAQRDGLLKELKIEQDRLVGVIIKRGFRHWMGKNFPLDLEEILSLEAGEVLVRGGDIIVDFGDPTRNMIYVFKLHRWICFDP